jgi:hypothetical protein
MRGIESLPVFLLLTEGSKFTSQMLTETLEQYLHRIECEWITSQSNSNIDCFDKLALFEDSQPFD